MSAGPRRRTLLAGAAAAAALGTGACTRSRPQAADPGAWPGGWVGAAHERGHRLRNAEGLADLLRRAALAPVRRADVLVVGAGIAGLAAARALRAGGITDLAVLELEDRPGGNSRGHSLNGQRCPLGAHYLPVPGPQAHEVAAWLEEIGLLRMAAGRLQPDERHLCHSPQERLFADGQWVDGLLPPAAPGSATLAQYRAFAQAVAAARRAPGFAMPSLRQPFTGAHAALDAQSFAQWLDAQGLTDPRLRWYLDYACRDDYGAGPAEVSAWAGLHYFGSRHGFAAPGEEAGERDAVFTWPEGNAFLAERLAAPLAPQLHTGRSVLQVQETRGGVQVLCMAEADARPEHWQARAVVLATPLFIAARLLAAAPHPLADALQAVRSRQAHAPWLVANLQLAEPLVDRGIGAPAAWDNVVMGSPSLGYVVADHQGLQPAPAAGQRPVLTAYWALPRSERQALLQPDWRPWAQRVVQDLAAVHPDLPGKLLRADLMRYGHAMSIPVPGLRGLGALQALAQASGRVRFAHADLAGYSVFEEAFTHGTLAGQALARWLRA
jgi:monoamine oxidase